MISQVAFLSLLIEPINFFVLLDGLHALPISEKDLFMIFRKTENADDVRFSFAVLCFSKSHAAFQYHYDHISFQMNYPFLNDAYNYNVNLLI